MNNNSVFDEVKAICKENLPSDFYHLWIEPLQLDDLTETKAVIKVKPSYYLDLVKRNFGKVIEEAFAKTVNHPIEVSFVVSIFPQCLNFVEGDPETGSSLSHYSFENFHMTASNKQAFALAQEVTDHPGAQINPLMICGGFEQEKKHLAFAIINGIKERYPSWCLVYRHIERYMSDIRNDLNNMNTDNMEKHGKADFFLLAGIDLAARSIYTQAELVLLFQKLLSENKQIVIIADTTVENLHFDNKELKDLLNGGTTVSIASTN